MLIDISRGSTLSNYKQIHYCRKHKLVVNRAHLEYCDLIGKGSEIKWMLDKANTTRWDDIMSHDQLKIKGILRDLIRKINDL